MTPVTVINHLVIKPGKMDEFIAAQQQFAARLTETPCGLVGGRMYRSLDGTIAVLVSTFESKQAQEDLRKTDAFKQHIARLAPLIESSNPTLLEVAYTTGVFK